MAYMTTVFTMMQASGLPISLTQRTLSRDMQLTNEDVQMRQDALQQKISHAKVNSMSLGPHLAKLSTDALPLETRHDKPKASAGM